MFRIFWKIKKKSRLIFSGCTHQLSNAKKLFLKKKLSTNKQETLNLRENEFHFGKNKTSCDLLFFE